MVLQCTTGVSTEDEDAEDDEENENYEDNITGKHKTSRQNKSVGMAEGLDDEYKVESKGKNSVTESLLSASIMLTERRI